ncbi:MAG: M42 family metallopeptidase [Oscillospiraceae bacterium]|nr:M42 family metallopeptidase [Oscillospiraceae bacterium]MBQ2328897.1 M42 family metallopeptidase [Oscillospiraceae bacterium]MBQ4302338.1 M42 family metallopeptidase [Oscillospiraceae bacterium]MBQ5467971.1 M42 family metallopeptidase [Oscillospiraceae bacterium]
MEQMKQYMEYAVQVTQRLLAADSPSGFTRAAEEVLLKELSDLGYEPKRTVKGGVLVDLGGEDANDGLLLQAHIDTLGAMVAEVKGSGRLRLTSLGGLPPVMANTENCRLYTKFNGVLEGTIQLCNASTHVNDNLRTTVPDYNNLELVLDEPAFTADAVRALGVDVGDVVCLDPRTRVTEKGYIKSRFLDDKLSAGILVGLAKYLKDEGLTPKRRVYAHFTIYEEVGHGGSGSVPAGVTESISVDMGCVGDGLQCTEHQVSICVKDSGGPYSYDVVTGLIAAAKAAGADYKLDVYPHYGSDVEATLRAGWDIRHGLIGPGVYASHGYERSHKDGVLATLQVLAGYLAR